MRRNFSILMALATFLNEIIDGNAAYFQQTDQNELH